MSPYKATLKGAELLGTMGVLLLGIGVGAWLGVPLTDYVLPVLILGGVCHALGMYAKHRLEAAYGGKQPGWYRALYWSCWVLLAVMAANLFLRQA